MTLQEMQLAERMNCAARSSAAMPGSAAVEARITAIKEVRYLCDEALDHDTGWATFCELVKRRLETESAFIEMAKSQPPNGELCSASDASASAIG